MAVESDDERTCDNRFHLVHPLQGQQYTRCQSTVSLQSFQTENTWKLEDTDKLFGRCAEWDIMFRLHVSLTRQDVLERWFYLSSSI